MNYSHEAAVTLQRALSVWTEFSLSVYVEKPLVTQAALAWAVTAFFATWGVLARYIRDTLLERIALAMISLGGFSRAFFIIGRGEIPLDGAITAYACCLYAIAIWYKYKIKIPRQRAQEGEPERRTSRKS